MKITDIFNKIRAKPTEVAKPISSFFQPVIAKAVAAPAPVIKTPARYSLKNRGVEVTDADIEAFRPLLYGEVSNRGPEKKALEANVIFNTALNRAREYNARGKKVSVADVLAMPNQYQAYGGTQYKAYSNPPDVVAAAKRKEVDAIIDQIHAQIKSGKFDDNTEGAYYYIHNPDGTIRYDSKKQLFAK